MNALAAFPPQILAAIALPFGLVVGSFVITTAVTIFWNAVNNVYDLLVGQGYFGGAKVIALWHCSPWSSSWG